MLAPLLRLQALAFWRAPFRGGRLALAGLKALGGAYALASATAIGFLLQDILSVVAPALDAVRTVDVLLLPALGAVLVARVLFQEVPTRGAAAFLALPVSRRRIAAVTLVRSLPSLFTLVPLAFVAPFALRTVAAAHGSAAALGLIGGAAALALASHAALVVWKTQLGAHPARVVAMAGAAVGLVVALERATGGAVAAFRAPSPTALGIAWGLALALGAVAARGVVEALYLDRPAARLRPRVRGRVGFRRPGVAAFLRLDALLLRRARYARGIAANAVLVSLALTALALFGPYAEATAVVLVFSTGALAGSLGQFAVPFASGHYDRLLTLPGGLAAFVRAKALLLGGAAAALALVQLPLVLWADPARWPLVFVSALYSAGVLAPAALFGSTLGPKPVDVDERMMFNYRVQAFGAQACIVGTGVVSGLPFAVWGPAVGVAVTAVLGAAGVAATPLWSRLLVRRLRATRHPVSARFRGSL